MADGTRLVGPAKARRGLSSQSSKATGFVKRCGLSGAAVISFPEPAEELAVVIFLASDFHCMAVSRGSDSLRSKNPVVPEVTV